MRRTRVANFAIGAIASVGLLSGCAATLRPKPSPATDLSGHWVLDPSQSETFEQAMRNNMDALPMSRGRGGAGGGESRGGSGRGSGMGGGSGMRGGMGGMGGGGMGGGGMRGGRGGGMPDDPNTSGGMRGGGSRSGAMGGGGMMGRGSLNKLADWPGSSIVIAQTPGSMQFESDGVTSRFKTGKKNCEIENYPLANRAVLNCGWDQQKWVLESDSKTRGPKVMELFYLSDDQKNLFQSIRLSGGRFGTLDIHRVYNAQPIN